VPEADPESAPPPGPVPLAFVFSAPTRIVYGEGTAAEAGIEMSALGGRRPLLVTDAGVRAAGLVDGVLKALGKSCAGVFDEVPQDTGVHVVERAAEAARAAGADGVISLGGGSVLDTAKGLALLLTEGGRLADYQGFQMLSRRQAFHVAIPTTAGTGSEVTFAALIKDHQARTKILLFDAHLAPDVAILDPALLASLPPRITAFTGMDALTHAVEAVHSLQAEPFSDALALHAVRLIAGYLPVCVLRGRDLEARGRLLVAAALAGQAFTNAMVGAVHALAHTLGGRFGVPHGLANAILLPFGMEYNLGHSAARYALVAEALGLRRAGGSDEQAARAAVKAVRELSARVGLPARLREAGVPREALAEIAEASLSDGSIVYNPRPADAASLTELLEAAW
jgi:alcohol dehydrogenase class IV